MIEGHLEEKKEIHIRTHDFGTTLIGPKLSVFVFVFLFVFSLSLCLSLLSLWLS